MHAPAFHGLKSLQRMEANGARDNQNSDCKATFLVGADNKSRRTSPSWLPRRGSPPAIEDTDDPISDSRQNEKPIFGIVNHFVTEPENA